jgi:hypothetical protein
VTPKALPEWSLISIIDPSPHDPGKAVVAVDRHRLDDQRPFIYRTTDYGKTWVMITNGIPEGAYVRSVREDPVRKGLLFAGTERGVYVSFDDGAGWQPLQLNLPMSPVHDLSIKGSDLIAATHGRSFWILDDIAPLRQAEAAGAAATADGVFLFDPAPAVRLHHPDWVERQRPAGQNPPPGAVIDYFIDKEPEGEVALDIFDAAGGLVRRFSSKEEKKAEQPPEWPDLLVKETRLPAAAGANRFVWDLRHSEPVQVPGAFYAGNPPEGPLALPGPYRLKLIAAGQSRTASLDLRPDPRVRASAEDLRRQFELASKTSARLSDLHRAVNEIRAVRAEMLVLRRRAAGTPAGPGLITAADAVETKMALIEGALIQVKLRSSEGTLAFPTMLNEQFYSLGWVIESADAAPARPVTETYDLLSQRLDETLASWKALQAGDIRALDESARKANLPWVGTPAS